MHLQQHLDTAIVITTGRWVPFLLLYSSPTFVLLLTGCIQLFRTTSSCLSKGLRQFHCRRSPGRIDAETCWMRRDNAIYHGCWHVETPRTEVVAACLASVHPQTSTLPSRQRAKACQLSGPILCILKPRCRLCYWTDPWMAHGRTPSFDYAACGQLTLRWQAWWGQSQGTNSGVVPECRRGFLTNFRH